MEVLLCRRSSSNPRISPLRHTTNRSIFFLHRPPEIAQWEEAVAEFKGKVPAIGRGLAAKIQQERQSSHGFATAFADFLAKCRSSINTNLSAAAVEEMLIQHLLTERIFRTVFSNPDFTRRNVIAAEIEKVIDALTSRSFNGADTLIAAPCPSGSQTRVDRALCRASLGGLLPIGRYRRARRVAPLGRCVLGVRWIAGAFPACR